MQRVSDPGGVARRQVGRVRGARHRLRREPRPLRYLARGDRRQRRATRMTTSPDNDTDPAWSADGKWIYFASTRSRQRAGVADLAERRRGRAGDEAAGRRRRLQAVPRRQAHLAGRVDVWPEAHDARRLGQARRRQGEVEGQGAGLRPSCCSATGITWEDGKYSHLFVWRSGEADDARDLTPRLDDATRRRSRSAAWTRSSISPDGKYRRVRRARRRPRERVDDEHRRVPGAGRRPRRSRSTSPPRTRRTTSSPTFSPDGKTLALARDGAPGLRVGSRSASR